jgi:heme exporter protein A
MSAMTAPDALPPPHLVASGVTVARGGRTLFSNLGFIVASRGLLLLRGANGAGKTSLLLAIAGTIRPEIGSIEYKVSGAAVEAAPLIHLLAIHNAIKPRLTVAENLDFWRAVNGPTGIAAGLALERVGLGGLEPIEAGHLSTGQQRRLALARLLVSRRAIWLLDEPTASLDSEGETLVAGMLAEHCDAGGIAVVATHQPLAVSAGTVATLTIAQGAGTPVPAP